jgi:predicted molibdopterin-dependent oxidoreductase YjgC
MLKHIHGMRGKLVSFTFEGRALDATADDSVASALLVAGEKVLRFSPVSGAQRSPFCMMGVCFECLVEIDGVPNRQACMLNVEEGMVVCRQGNLTEATRS